MVDFVGGESGFVVAREFLKQNKKILLKFLNVCCYIIVKVGTEEKKQ